MLNNYPDTFAFVQIHRGDDFVTAWANARWNFYGAGGYPSTYFDGVLEHSGSHTYTLYNNEFQSRAVIDTDVTIDLTADFVSGQTYNVFAEVCVEAGGTSKPMRIYMVQVLDNWPLASEGGKDYSRNGFKQAADTHGSEPDIAVAAGSCQEVQRQFTFDARSWSAQDDITIIAWAQEPDSSYPAEVYQAGIMHWPFPPHGAPNDDCADAIETGNGSYSSSTELATNDGDATCGTSSSSPDVWFAYRGPADGTVEIDSCGSSFDTVLSVHTDCLGTTANELDCNDNSDVCGVGSSQSYLTMSVTEGTVYMVRLSGYDGAYGEYDITFDGPADVTAPTPDPMTFDVAPWAVGDNEVQMTASLASDVGSPTIEYEFDLVSGGSGGDGSGWQSSLEYADTGLATNTAYTYRVRARDGVENATAYSTPSVTVYTLANTPGRPNRTNIACTSMDLTISPADNPANTEFAIQCATSTPSDPNWTGKFMDASGNPIGSEVWQTQGQWGTITAQGLAYNTTYHWRVKARNGDNIETAYSSWGSSGTFARGDLDDDGNVDLDDYALMAACLAGPDVTEPPPGCGPVEFECSDLDAQGDADLADFAEFATIMDE